MSTPALVAKAVLFDLDGTLIETAQDLGDAANRVRLELGLKPLPLINYRDQASAGARGMLGIALGITPDHVDFPARRDSFLAHYRANITQHSRPFPGIAQLLLGLQLKGIRWGVVTNKPGWLTLPLLQALKLADGAASIVSGDSTPRPKPAPDPILLACTQMQLAPADCLYVGDDERDIVAARAAGMRSVAAGWGYIGGGRPIVEWGADVITPTVDALHGLLL